MGGSACSGLWSDERSARPPSFIVPRVGKELMKTNCGIYAKRQFQRPFLTEYRVLHVI